MRDAAAAAKLLAELRGADSLAALADLTAWLHELEHLADRDEVVHAEIVALVMEAGDPHVGKLATAYSARPDRKQGQKPAWQPIDGYLASSLRVMQASATRLLEQARSDPARRNAAAAATARALHACRMLAKSRLLRHASVPSETWRTAYALHRQAESAACSILPVRLHSSHRTTCTADQELVRLLMLQCASPEMMTPAQVDVADWMTEQLGCDFTLRPRGATDNPFCFDEAGDAPPRRASQPDAALRCFGPGMAYEALQRMFSQMSTAGADPKETAEAGSREVRLSALQHLLAFWGEKAPYTPPERVPATGEVRVVHGYSQAWQQLSGASKNVMELSLAEDGDVPLDAPEKWMLVNKGGSELGAHIPHPASDFVRCGDVVALSSELGEGWWLGLIRSMHAEAGGAKANIHVISVHPQAVQLRAVVEDAEERGVSEQTARQFSYATVRAIVVSDGAATPQPANLLLPPASWKSGQAFELAVDGVTRYLRCTRLLRRGDDYVRAAFEWMEQP